MPEMPAWVRQVQQSWYFQIATPFVVAFLTELVSCAGTDMSHLSRACWIAAGYGTVKYTVVYLIGVSQHSPGSASFDDKGQPNVLVERAVEVQKAAAATPPGSDAHLAATQLLQHAEAVAKVVVPKEA